MIHLPRVADSMELTDNLIHFRLLSLRQQNTIMINELLQNNILRTRLLRKSIVFVGY